MRSPFSEKLSYFSINIYQFLSPPHPRTPPNRQAIPQNYTTGTRGTFSHLAPGLVLTCVEHKHSYLFKQFTRVIWHVAQKQPRAQNCGLIRISMWLQPKRSSYHSAPPWVPPGSLESMVTPWQTAKLLFMLLIESRWTEN